MKSDNEELFQHRCGHCLYAIKLIEPAKSVSLACPECGVTTRYNEFGIPRSTELPEDHICDHVIHAGSNPWLKMLLVRPPGAKRVGRLDYIPIRR